MKSINKVLSLIIIFSSLVATVKAQETMYIYKDGAIVGEHILADVDSVIFYKAEVPEENTVTDIDGNVYNTVVIGTQTWMAENLKTTKFQNGDIIGTTTPATLNISEESAPKYQWAYSGDENNVADYGRLYTYYIVSDSRNVCPSGWHIPSSGEWNTLISYLGGESIAGDKLKEVGNKHWSYSNTSSTNISGFSALPGGNRGSAGIFQVKGVYGYWWTSSIKVEGSAIAIIMWTDSSYAKTIIGTFQNYEIGNSIRCIKD